MKYFLENTLTEKMKFKDESEIHVSLKKGTRDSFKINYMEGN